MYSELVRVHTVFYTKFRIIKNYIIRNLVLLCSEYLLSGVIPVRFTDKQQCVQLTQERLDKLFEFLMQFHKNKVLSYTAPLCISFFVTAYVYPELNSFFIYIKRVEPEFKPHSFEYRNNQV